MEKIGIDTILSKSRNFSSFLAEDQVRTLVFVKGCSTQPRLLYGDDFASVARLLYGDDTITVINLVRLLLECASKRIVLENILQHRSLRWGELVGAVGAQDGLQLAHNTSPILQIDENPDFHRVQTSSRD